MNHIESTKTPTAGVVTYINDRLANWRSEHGY